MSRMSRSIHYLCQREAIQKVSEMHVSIGKWDDISTLKLPRRIKLEKELLFRQQRTSNRLSKIATDDEGGL